MRGKALRARLAGIGLVARYELRMRGRAGRWRWLLVIWFVILFLVTLGVREAVAQTALPVDQRGTVMYGVLMLITLGLALLISPSLTAQAINGDRQRGTLATLQATRLTAFEIAAGKLAAAWGTALVFLVVTAPLVGWSIAEGGVSAARVVVVTVVVALLLGVICSIALGLSALLARVTTSGVLSYLAVFTLTVGTLIAFGLATLTTQETVRVSPASAGQSDCAVRPDGSRCAGPDSTGTITRARPDRTWWLLAPNPFVVLAGAAPVAPAPKRHCHNVDVAPAAPTPEASPGIAPPSPGSPTERVCSVESTFDPLGAIARGVRDLRTPPQSRGWSAYTPLNSADPIDNAARGGPVWPWGLGFDVIVGAGMLYIATRRLRTPARKLAPGVRVA
jgi:ABC-type transport system involved in multi-copper enzyme maturation permease subunit